MPAQIVVAFASYQSVLSAGAQGIDFAPLLQLHACRFETCDTVLGAGKAEADGAQAAFSRAPAAAVPAICGTAPVICGPDAMQLLESARNDD